MGRSEVCGEVRFPVVLVLVLVFGGGASPTGARAGPAQMSRRPGDRPAQMRRRARLPVVGRVCRRARE